MTPDEVLALLTVIARQQAQISYLEQQVGALQQSVAAANAAAAPAT
jgi:uncharacterized coiled-coil protein SlyX